MMSRTYVGLWRIRLFDGKTYALTVPTIYEDCEMILLGLASGALFEGIRIMRALIVPAARFE
jgi:hypothetical protein